MSSISENRSALKDFLASIATIRGDLSNITAPPFVLADKSAVEFPQYWASYPSTFTAPASEPDPQKRALLVLKWFLSSLKAQQYAGRSENEGVKKPLNAFLGELFLGNWQDENGRGTTRLISEQVSHHPPVTATILWNDEFGIRAEGYTCQEITFNGSVNIKQIGHAILHIDKYDEDYLIPLPNVRVKGILSGSPYPELSGTYKIVSSNGFTSEIEFSGRGFFSGGEKNSFKAKLYRDETPETPLYTVTGQWVRTFTIHDVSSSTDIETYDANAQSPVPITVADRAQQDPWESRRAWGGVIDALHEGNMQATSDEKGKIERAQRAMRKEEAKDGRTWRQVFFKTVEQDELFEQLARKTGEGLNQDRTKGIWKFDWEMAEKQHSFHDGWTPTGKAGARPLSPSSSSESESQSSLNSSTSAVRSQEEQQQQREEDVRAAEPAAAKKVVPAEGARDSAIFLSEKALLEDVLRDKYAAAGNR